jgi:hypothetical protein
MIRIVSNDAFLEPFSRPPLEAEPLFGEQGGEVVLDELPNLQRAEIVRVTAGFPNEQPESIA